ncbi:mechanosensitive ion channel family protein [Klebsiella pneumoniae]|nr:mechanosensitive ion channel family protein [Klebsiella pneumoniae]
MPDKNLSGEVTDIALHTITIRNWDNTISRIPTKNFLTETYTNWQAMFSSGARRIMHAVSPSINTRCVFSTRRCSPRC